MKYSQTTNGISGNELIEDENKKVVMQHKQKEVNISAESKHDEHTHRKIDTVLAPKFRIQYEKASDELKTLFDGLIEKVNEIGILNLSTDTPDYRLRNKVNFCLITFLQKENALKIHLRTDGLKLHSDIIEVRELEKNYHNGKEWVEIKLRECNEINEVVGLIECANNLF